MTHKRLAPHDVEVVDDHDLLVRRTLVDAKQWSVTLTVMLISMLVIGFAIGFATGGWILVRAK